MRSKLLLVAALIVLACVASVLLGHRVIYPRELVGAMDPVARMLVFDLRLPRTMAALLVGATLGLAGGLLQGATRNVLAEPGLLGIHSGAQLALLGCVMVAPPAVASQLVAPVAFAGGAFAALVVFVAARRRGGAFHPGALLLVGIAVGAALQAASVAVTLSAPFEKFTLAMAWTTGTLSGIGWKEATVVGAALLAMAPVAYLLAASLDVLGLGENVATTLGARPGRVRLLAVALAVFGASIAASVSGGIAFLGLLAPNLARRIVGPRHRPLLALSAGAGALILVVADTLARTAFTAGDMPTGVLTSAVGAPYFLWLLMTR